VPSTSAHSALPERDTQEPGASIAALPGGLTAGQPGRRVRSGLGR
jgi:hypothetical protein